MNKHTYKTLMVILWSLPSATQRIPDAQTYRTIRRIRRQLGRILASRSYVELVCNLQRYAAEIADQLRDLGADHLASLLIDADRGERVTA